MIACRRDAEQDTQGQVLVVRTPSAGVDPSSPVHQSTRDLPTSNVQINIAHHPYGYKGTKELLPHPFRWRRSIRGESPTAAPAKG